MGGIDKFIEEAKSSDENMLIQRFMLRDQVSGEILQFLNEAGISKVDLARKLKMSRSNISRLLSGDRNMTLDTISDIAFQLDCVINFKMKDRASASSKFYSYACNSDQEIEIGSMTALQAGPRMAFFDVYKPNAPQETDSEISNVEYKANLA